MDVEAETAVGLTHGDQRLAVPRSESGQQGVCVEVAAGHVEVDEETMRNVLETVNLPEVAARVDGDFDRPADWANMLSLGEQQRLSFARLLLKNPAIAFLDESTSALDEPNEERMYEYLLKHRYTFVSVGHRSTLLKHHDWLLRIGDEGSWELLKTADLEKEAS